jgi:hypothetical protein
MFHLRGKLQDSMEKWRRDLDRTSTLDKFKFLDMDG